MRSWLLSLSLFAMVLGGCCGTRRCNPCDRNRNVQPCNSGTACADGQHWYQPCIYYDGGWHTRYDALGHIMDLAVGSDPERTLARQLAYRIRELTNATYMKEMSTGDPVTCNNAAIQAAVNAARAGYWPLTIDKLAQGH